MINRFFCGFFCLINLIQSWINDKAMYRPLPRTWLVKMTTYGLIYRKTFQSHNKPTVYIWLYCFLLQLFKLDWFFAVTFKKLQQKPNFTKKATARNQFCKQIFGEVTAKNQLWFPILQQKTKSRSKSYSKKPSRGRKITAKNQLRTWGFGRYAAKNQFSAKSCSEKQTSKKQSCFIDNFYTH